VTLPKAIETINGLSLPPDFIVFTGDLTHTTDDPYERRMRMTGFSKVVSDLKVKTVHFMPGEHDAGLDFGTAYKEMFGPAYYTFDHEGVHFIALDNVSDPRGMGKIQLDWLKSQLAALGPQTRIVVLAHRPLFDLYPQWEWATRDGAEAIALLMPFENVTVFYGHIHQENHHMTGHIAHHSALSLAWPLPFPGSKPKPKPVPWDAAEPYRGLGVRGVTAETAPVRYDLLEISVTRKAKA
jgi:3',5'-cyclic AMP phosphodiesterase CpdA